MGMRFSRIEKTDLLKSWAAITIAFAIVMEGLNFSFAFLISLIISAFTVGIGFLIHELAHRQLAKKYGYWAEYRADDKMLIFMILVSFFGFIFAAPGGVIIQGNVSKKRNGKISAAGPGSSIILVLVFIALHFILPSGDIINSFTKYGMIINGWLAVFNLLPFWNFDGKKVLAWNKAVYGVMMVSAIFLTLIAFVI